MKMKQLLVVVLCVFSFFGSGQNEDVNIKIGASLKYDRDSEGHVFVVNGYNYLATYSDETKVSITKFNSDLSINVSNEIELKYNGLKAKVLKVYSNDKSIVIISHSYLKKSGKEGIYRHFIDINNLTEKSQSKIGEIGLSENHEKEHYLKMIFSSSPDNDKHLIYYRDYHVLSKKKAKGTLGFIVFDNEFRKVWSKNTTTPVFNQLYDSDQCLIDDNSSVYLLGRKLNSDPKKRLGNNNTFGIIKYTKDNAVEIPIETGGEKISYLKMKLRGDDIFLGGYVSRNSILEIEGAIFVKIDKVNNKQLKKVSFTFKDKFVKHGLLESLMAEGTYSEKGQLYFYDLKDIIITDNYISLISEQVTSEAFVSGTIKQRMDGDVNSTTTVYYHMDVILTQVSTDFTGYRAKKITKVQASLNNSIVTRLNNNTIHILYNDRPGNPSAINPDKIPMTYNIGKCLVKRVSLNDGGDFYENEFVTNDKRTYIVPSIQSSNVKDKLVFYTNKSKEGKLVEFTFKK